MESAKGVLTGLLMLVIAFPLLLWNEGRAVRRAQDLEAGRGAVVELDRKLGEAIDIYANNRLVARGEVVMVDDIRLGVTMTEIVKADRAP